MDLKVIPYLALFNLVNYFSATIADLDIRALTLNAALSGHRLLSIPGISIQDCWTHCEIRLSCKSVNYKRQGHVCELNSVGDWAILQHKVIGWVFYKKQDLITKVQCGSTSCGNMETCDRITETCMKECEQMQQKAERYAKGNMVSVGDKALLGCNNGFLPSTGSDVSVTSECITDGVWLPEMSCMQTCNNGGTRPSTTSQTSYEILEHGVWKTMPCALGTAFSLDTCSCSILAK